MSIFQIILKTAITTLNIVVLYSVVMADKDNKTRGITAAFILANCAGIWL